MARRAVQPERKARALKMLGDTEWKRDDFETASVRYDSALVHARQAHADTLSRQLAVLAPAALYRFGEKSATGGDSRRAAATFERVAREHPGFEHADRALYRAGHLRAASHEDAAAARNYEHLAAGWPHSDLHADALLELGKCQESLGARADAARTLRSVAAQHPNHAQATATHLRAGELFAATGAVAAADSEYARVLLDLQPKGQAKPRDPALAADVWLRRARLARSPQTAGRYYRNVLACGAEIAPPARGEAWFHVAEAQRGAYQGLELRAPVAASLRRKQAALEKLLGGYAKSAAAQVEPWHAAACLRIGEALQDLGGALRKSAPPAELQGDDLAAYQETLATQCQALEDRAVESWSRGARAARVAGLHDTWMQALESRLYPLLAKRLPTQPAPLFVLVQP